MTKTPLERLLGDIIFERPTNTRERVRWDERLSPLLSHPNEWARVHTIEKESIARSTVAGLRKRKLAVPEGDWVFTAERLKSGEGWGIYACYLGPSIEEETTP